MAKRRVLVVGDTNFFLKISRRVTESDMADVDCYPAEDAIEALLKMNEDLPYALIIDVSESSFWGVNLVQVAGRHFPSIGIVAISESFDIPLTSGRDMVLLSRGWGTDHLRQAFEILSRHKLPREPNAAASEALEPATGHPNPDASEELV